MLSLMKASLVLIVASLGLIYRGFFVLGLKDLGPAGCLGAYSPEILLRFFPPNCRISAIQI